MKPSYIARVSRDGRNTAVGTLLQVCVTFVTAEVLE
jgi:hypothetical protein